MNHFDIGRIEDADDGYRCHARIQANEDAKEREYERRSDIET